MNWEIETRIEFCLNVIIGQFAFLIFWVITFIPAINKRVYKTRKAFENFAQGVLITFILTLILFAILNIVKYKIL